MSPLLRPVGPLPAQVYWTRRLVVLVVAVLLGWLVAALVTPGDSGGGKAGASAAGGTSTSRSPSAAPRTASPSPEVPAPKAASTTSSKKPNQPPAGQPDVRACEAGAIRLSVDATRSGVAAGRPVPVAIRFENAGADPCRLAINPERLRLVVTSGADRIWDSADCPSIIEPGRMKLPPDQPRALPITWSGFRSSEGCPPNGQKALPGYYVVQATIVDGPSDTGRFRLT